MTQTTTAKVYVGTYKKYNEGSLFGKWMNLGDYTDAEDFLKACYELHADEQDPELMFQDYEGFPKFLYGESMSTEELQKIYDLLEIIEKVEDYTEDEWVNLHNQYCQNINADGDEIYSFDDEFFNTFFEGKPMEAARAATFGDMNWSDDYITFNGYGNLVTLNKYNLFNHIDKDAILQDVADDPTAYNI